MKSRKKAMRKFKKKSIWIPIIIFGIGAIIIFNLSFGILKSQVEGVANYKMISAKEEANAEVYDAITSLDRYDYDIDKALEDRDLEMAVIKDDEIVYSNTGVVLNKAIVQPEDDDENEKKDNVKLYFAQGDGNEISTYITIKDSDFFENIKKNDLTEYVLEGMKNGNYGVSLVSVDTWVATDVKYMGGTVIAHKPIVISYADVIQSVYIVFFAGLIFLFVSITFLWNLIASIVNNNRMLKALYFDDKTLTNNWLYFTTKGEKMLRKKKGVFGVLSVKVCKYNHCKSCSGVASADNMIFLKLQELTKYIKKKDLIARNADAYIGILVKRNSVDEIKAMIDTIVNNTSEPVYVGAYIYTSNKKKRPNDEGIEDYYHFARLACDSVDESDNDGIEYFDDELKEKNRWINTVESKLDAAIANEEFVVYIQPKYDPKESVLKGAEALIRWVSPEYGLIAPGRFIPICEENGSIVKIDDYMISHIARLQSEWISKGYEVVPVSVNVSRVHFMDPNLAEHIASLVDRYNAPHDSIEIELTESAFFDDKKALLCTVDKLQALGFQVSMDDFGSGYSSLNSLKDLSIDVLKLDADFFRGEGREKRGELIVGKAIELAKSLDMQTVAEGVELQEQVEFLANAGCDMIQGYYYAKPMPSEEFEKRMTNETVTEEVPENNTEETVDVALAANIDVDLIDEATETDNVNNMANDSSGQ